MVDNKSPGGGRENPHPLGLDTKDPEGIASFGLYLGYDEDNIVQGIVERCNLDRITARRIVKDAARNNQMGR
jgi:hypothetical protein